jgi:acylphosphatase
MVNYHLTIYGRVQGVGFRWAVFQLANRQQLTGLVRNQADGSVYCELQGQEAAVKELITQIKAGPTPYAKVIDVQISRGEIANYNNSFSISR